MIGFLLVGKPVKVTSDLNASMDPPAGMLLIADADVLYSPDRLPQRHLLIAGFATVDAIRNTTVHPCAACGRLHLIPKLVGCVLASAQPGAACHG